MALLKNEVEDLQREFEREREEYLDSIRKQERQLKLLLKLTQKIQPLIPHDCNYYNLDKIQSMAAWNEEMQDWILPELKREKLSLPTMMTREATSLDLNNNGRNHHSKRVEYQDEETEGVGGGSGSSGGGGIEYEPNDLIDTHHQLAAQNMMINRRVDLAYQQQQQQHQQQNYMIREPPEMDRYRIKLENSQFDGSGYFRTKRQSELLSQTQDLKANGRLSPVNNLRSSSTRKYY